MTAQSKGAQLQPGSMVRWDRLEKAAFASHPEVFEPIRSPRSRHNNWNLIWAVPLVIVYLFCFTGPIWGTAAISVSRFQAYHQPTEERIPLAGTFFILAALLLLVSIGHWAITRHQFQGLYRTQAALAFFLGLLTSLAISYWGTRDSVESWHTWVIPVIVATVLGGVFLVLLLLVRDPHSPTARPRGTGVGRKALPPNVAVQLNQRKERIAQLSDSDRAAITHDLNAAIGDLERRGLISATIAANARDTELGALGLPRRRFLNGPL